MARLPDLTLLDRDTVKLYVPLLRQTKLVPVPGKNALLSVAVVITMIRCFYVIKNDKKRTYFIRHSPLKTPFDEDTNNKKEKKNHDNRRN